MLDTTTKRRIDTARDILVGKVPDPKSQVEQITIALIYKFMDDMDLDAEELGGEPSFFSGEYEKYGWRKIFNPTLGGFEMLSLYSEAILKMAQNPNLPQLFRDIFKNAYLPYRDPETLKSFLKIINDFSYDHSEKLGDAFEYLLSVLGSQGDAGQFRTPRHVIDFMTALIAPKKNETVLDPACGTAGFLISAYKHILKENSSNYDKTDPYTFEQNNVKLAEITVNGKHYKGDKLSPDDRARIIQNIKGYDISPDMVRLSLVNLYLHGFTDPHIHEYDTLTSEERWNEFYDIILANPPFMSPKGGIRPHKRFAVQSKRSEVLFVDYMAEHLTPTGKAAIIVPEGIIFQSGTAYKSLRKMLVEDNYLVGVISLPAGVFNPYSGVKTSILWLDKTLAKKTDKILFAKIENDGFDLGAQRRPIKQNDLPAAFRALQEWKGLLERPFQEASPESSVGPRHGVAQRTGHGLSRQDSSDNSATQILQSIFPNISLVEKEKIAENGEFNLSGERYKDITNHNSDFEYVSIADENVFKVVSGGTPDSKNEDYWNGNINWATLVDLPASELVSFINSTERKISENGLKHSSAKLLPPNSVIVSTRATIGRVAINKVECSTNQGFKNIIIADSNRVNAYFVALMMTQLVDKMSLMATGGTFKELSTSNFKTLKIPLPPLSIQEEIVAEIESYQKIIDGARQVVGNYKPRIDIDPEWEMVELQDVCSVTSGGTPDRKNDDYWNGNIPYVKTGEIFFNKIIQAEEFITEEGLNNSSARLISPGTILMAMYGQGVTRGRVAILEIEAAINQAVAAISCSDKINNEFLFYQLIGLYEHLRMISDARGGNQSNLNGKLIKELKIVLPALETQNQIVAQIEKEQELVNANKQLIEIFEQKIKDRIAKVWGE